MVHEKTGLLAGKTLVLKRNSGGPQNQIDAAQTINDFLVLVRDNVVQRIGSDNANGRSTWFKFCLGMIDGGSPWLTTALRDLKKNTMTCDALAKKGDKDEGGGTVCYTTTIALPSHDFQGFARAQRDDQVASNTRSGVSKVSKKLSNESVTNMSHQDIVKCEVKTIVIDLRTAIDAVTWFTDVMRGAIVLNSETDTIVSSYLLDDHRVSTSDGVQLYEALMGRVFVEGAPVAMLSTFFDMVSTIMRDTDASYIGGPVTAHETFDAFAGRLLAAVAKITDLSMRTGVPNNMVMFMNSIDMRAMEEGKGFVEERGHGLCTAMPFHNMMMNHWFNK